MWEFEFWFQNCFLFYKIIIQTINILTFWITKWINFYLLHIFKSDKNLNMKSVSIWILNSKPFCKVIIQTINIFPFWIKKWINFYLLHIFESDKNLNMKSVSIWILKLNKHTDRVLVRSVCEPLDQGCVCFQPCESLD